jgi:hypothetical protein
VVSPFRSSGVISYGDVDGAFGFVFRLGLGMDWSALITDLRCFGYNWIVLFLSMNILIGFHANSTSGTLGRV